MATRARLAVPRSYEDFQPSSNLLQEENCETLIVDLPGFRKEHIRVQMDDRSGAVIISGERPIGNNKWNRFRKSLRVPTNCNTNEIQAKFENGVLRIIMPLKVEPAMPQQSQQPKPIAPPPPPPPPRPPLAPSQEPVTKPRPTPTSQTPLNQKPVAALIPNPQPPTNTQKQVIEPKPIPTPPPPPPPTRKPSFTESDPLSKREARMSMSEKLGLKQPLHDPLSQKTLTDDSKPTPTLKDPLSQNHTTESTQTPSIKSTISQALGIKSKYDNSQDNSTDNVDHSKTGKSENGAERFDGIFEDGGKSKSSLSEKQKEKEIQDAHEVKDKQRENVSHGVADFKKGAGKLGMELDESKQHIVNIIAAVVVIIALWVYVKYTIKSLW